MQSKQKRDGDPVPYPRDELHSIHPTVTGKICPQAVKKSA